MTITEEDAKGICDLAIKFVFDQVPNYELLIKKIKVVFEKSCFVDLLFFDEAPFIVWIKRLPLPLKERLCKQTAENLKNILQTINGGQILIYLHSDERGLDRNLNGQNLKDSHILLPKANLDAERIAKVFVA
ncbi:MAG: hypothetical protein IJV38_06475 [Prevotella sp.]|nr:hypothetical protein [Prevotella sp.]MBQ9655652.1 hypothetical protein [Prevotella sp.]